MTLAQLIMPMGVITFFSLLVTMITGLAIFRFHVGWMRMQWHMWSAAATLIFAVIHAALVIFLY